MHPQQRVRDEDGEAVQTEATLLVDVRYDSDDKLFIAEVRNLQGCWASGPTEEALASNLRTAISDYYELFEDSEVVDIAIGKSVPDEDAEHGHAHSEVRVLAGAC